MTNTRKQLTVFKDNYAPLIKMLHKSDINRMLSNRAVITKCDNALFPTREISRLGDEFYLRTQGNLEIITTENIPKDLSDIIKSYLAIASKKPYIVKQIDSNPQDSLCK